MTVPIEKKNLFVSYHHRDLDSAEKVARAVQQEYDRREVDVHVWVAHRELRPGEQWDVTIARALEVSIGVLVLHSEAARDVSLETIHFLERIHQDRLVIPVILEPTTRVPFALTTRRTVDISAHSQTQIDAAARIIVDETERYLRWQGAEEPLAPISNIGSVAATIAEEARGALRRDLHPSVPPASVFVVHGHNEDALKEVEDYLTSLGIRAVVISRIPGPSPSLFQKFWKTSTEAKFAVVVLTADDVGASREQYDTKDVGARALQFRARQNVILELGFFYGLLGWEKVFVVYRKPNKKFPNFERPSDLDGVVFDTIDATGNWKQSLAEKLRDAGFQIVKST